MTAVAAAHCAPGLRRRARLMVRAVSGQDGAVLVVDGSAGAEGLRSGSVDPEGATQDHV